MERPEFLFLLESLMPPEMTSSEFYVAVLERLDRFDDLFVAMMIAACCVASGMAFQVVLYAVRNKNFWGCVALGCGLVCSTDACAGCWPNGACVNDIVVLEGFCDGNFWVTRGTATYLWDGTLYGPFEWILSVRKTNGAFNNCIFYSTLAGGPYNWDKTAATTAGFWGARLPFPGTCVQCNPIDNPEDVGFNCCSAGKFGATYYIAKDVDGCDYLACNSAACHSCPTPPSTPEGTSCSCGQGQGNGVIAYTYDVDGCPVGTICDGCEPCDDISEQIGETCTTGDGDPGHMTSIPGQDGCPTLICAADDLDPCIRDTNRDGTPDYLEGNLYKDAAEGSACVCLNDEEGTIEMRSNEDGCPVPTCSCENECTAGDKDGDGCCDDEDPDPDDPSVDCEDCNNKLAEKLGELRTRLISKIQLPSSVGGSKSWQFDVNFGDSTAPGVAAFGIRFGGDLTAGTFWLQQPDSSPRAEQGEIISTALQYRALIRTILSACVYCAFSYATLTALFNPAR